MNRTKMLQDAGFHLDFGGLVWIREEEEIKFEFTRNLCRIEQYDRFEVSLVQYVDLSDEDAFVDFIREF